MSKFTITIGVVCFVRHTYDYQAAAEIYENVKTDLDKIPDVTWVYAEQMVITKEDAVDAAKELQAQGVDAVAMISGTFHLGHLALTIDHILKKPVLLWAFEELPYDGGKIRLNSLCGLNLNASNLYKAGNHNFHYTISNEIDQNWLAAVKMKAALEKSHIGLAGYRADGFFNLGIDELHNFSETGVLLDHYELQDMYDREVDQEETEKVKKEIKKSFVHKEIDEERLDKLARLCLTTEQFLDEYHLDALAVRCWPEYAAKYGIAPCAMMSILQAKGRILACEGDIEGAMTMLACQAAGAATPYLADFSQVDFVDNTALLWHCGVAPSNLWDKVSERSLDTYFAGGKGITSGFVCKTGEITIVRIDSANGKTRICFGRGEVLPMEKQLSGTYARVRFELPVKELLDSLLKNGIAHHVVMVYGEYKKQFELFAKIMNYEIIEW